MNDAETGRPILVTGGDATYFPMIEELLASVRATAPLLPPVLGVVDAGLTGEQVDSLRAAGVSVR